MTLLVYGGSFNPPHIGHISALRAAAEALNPDKLLVIPANLPPHKAMAEGSPSAEERTELCSLAFESVPGAEICGMEIARGGASYTSDTLRCLLRQYPGARVTLLMGTDMLATLEGWHEHEFILQNASFAAVARSESERAALEQAAERLRRGYGADVAVLSAEPVPASSTDIRAALPKRGGREYLTAGEYARIIQKRLYGARPELQWLRERAAEMLKPARVPHVLGCEQEAVKLAKRWGADTDDAAEAAICHDITKKLSLPEQLLLCKKYGIIADEPERSSEKLLHAKTGAAVAGDIFGMSETVCSAIRWHTTGRAGMSLLEKVIYMADYIEPTRAFDGVEPLRALAYKDLDAAMVLGLEMSLQEVREKGAVPHPDSISALAALKNGE
ncbi:MAG: nicotinate (nicotinamide) nucleotide adenylyltransferase [Oscillospiraceae bacterium]|nr:nicotinate (nicotinamide) nucleotide adenylyltransferase [Oscillospiraceae bacterium]